MLRIHFMQEWFGLSDPAMEEALQDIVLFRKFAQIDVDDTRLPDEHAIHRFRQLLESNNLLTQMQTAINAKLIERGLLLKTGTVVDVSLIF